MKVYDPGMNMSREHQTETQFRGSWIPQTPVKPCMLKPQPICLDGRVNQTNQVNCPESERDSPSFGPEPQANGAVPWPSSFNCTEINRGCAGSEAALDRNPSIVSNNVTYVMEKSQKLRFTHLIELADAASLESRRSDGTATGSSVDTSDGHPMPQTPETKLAVPRQCLCDLNWSPRTMECAVPYTTISQLAPITPDKCIRAESSSAAEIDRSRNDVKANQERDKQEKRRAPTSLDTFNDPCSNEKLPETRTDLSVAAVSTTLKENNNPGGEGSHGIDLNKTPQQKPPGRKHSPRVIIEDKLKHLIKLQAGSEKNTRVKRKYVRKKGVNNDTTLSAEATEGSNNPKTLEKKKKSCRRALNFDTEAQPQDNSSTFKSTSGLEAESQAQNFSTREIPRSSTVQLETPETKLVIPRQCSCDLNWSARTVECAVPYTTISKHAPITPDKCMRAESSSIAEIDRFHDDVKANQERDKQEKRSTPTSLDTFKDVHSNEKLPDTGTDSSVAAVSIMLKENNNPGGEGSHGIDPNKTPQQKTRRRKHRPKVIIEDKLKRVIKLQAGSEKNTRVKRKYVRKKGVNKDTTVPAEVTEGSDDPKTLESKKKSCRGALNFDTEAQPRDNSSTCKSTSDVEAESQAQNFSPREIPSTVQLENGIVATGSTYDLGGLENYMPFPESQAPRTPLPANTNYLRREQERHNANSEVKNAEEKDSVYSTSIMLTEEGEERGIKRKCSDRLIQANSSTTNLCGLDYSNLHAYQLITWVHFPENCKRRRSEKGTNSTSSRLSSSTAKALLQLEKCPQNDTESNSSLKTECWIVAPNSNEIPATLGGATRLQERLQILEAIQGLTNMEWQKKKRSRVATRARDLASLFKMDPTYPGNQATLDRDRQGIVNLHVPPINIQAVVAEMQWTLTKKKRSTKSNSLVNSASSSIHNPQQSSANLLGASPEILWRQTVSVDGVTEHLKDLDINRESTYKTCREQNAIVPYYMENQGQNALVLYRRDGMVVPFEGSFETVKKRRPRPKVELDEETNRVWKLLLGNINSEGIDGTDEEKVKWWEEERKVFCGRADSFIARMHLVQGMNTIPNNHTFCNTEEGIMVQPQFSEMFRVNVSILGAVIPLKKPHLPEVEEKNQNKGRWTHNLFNQNLN